MAWWLARASFEEGVSAPAVMIASTAPFGATSA